MLPISVCIIAKNEEKYIEECLRRLSCYDWEIIVVDTGSTDRTVKIAQSFTPLVYHFDWVDDFSAAKNYSVSKASHDLILTVDADEYLEKNETTDSLIATLADRITPKQVGMLHRLSPAATSSVSPMDESAPLVHEHIARLFNKKYTHYQGIIHEQLVSKTGEHIDFVPIPLTFYHMGYSTTDIKKEKATRNISMLKTALKQNPSDPYILFQLGQSYFGLEDYEHSLIYFEKALSLDVNELEEYVQTMVESYGYCLLNTKQYTKALELEGIYDIFCKSADFIFLMGLVYMNNAMFEQAIHQFLKATTISISSVDGVNSYKAFYNIGVIYECLGNQTQAMKYYKKCGKYAPALARIELRK